MAQQSGEGLKNCIECGNTVSMLYTEHEGEIYCMMCYDTMMDAKEEKEKEKEKKW